MLYVNIIYIMMNVFLSVCVCTLRKTFIILFINDQFSF